MVNPFGLIVSRAYMPPENASRNVPPKVKSLTQRAANIFAKRYDHILFSSFEYYRKNCGFSIVALEMRVGYGSIDPELPQLNLLHENLRENVWFSLASCPNSSKEHLKSLQASIFDPVRLIGGYAQALLSIRLVIRPVPFGPADLALPSKARNRSRSGPETSSRGKQPPRSRRNSPAPLQGEQRVRIQVVGRLVKQQNVHATVALFAR